MRRLLSLGVRVHLSKAPDHITGDRAALACTWTGAITEIPADAVVMVTSRTPHDGLYQDLRARQAEWEGAGIKSIRSKFSVLKYPRRRPPRRCVFFTRSAETDGSRRKALNSMTALTQDPT